MTIREIRRWLLHHDPLYVNAKANICFCTLLYVIYLRIFWLLHTLFGFAVNTPQSTSTFVATNETPMFGSSSTTTTRIPFSNLTNITTEWQSKNREKDTTPVQIHGFSRNLFERHGSTEVPTQECQDEIGICSKWHTFVNSSTLLKQFVH